MIVTLEALDHQAQAQARTQAQAQAQARASGGGTRRGCEAVLYVEEHDGKLTEAERATTTWSPAARELASNNAGSLLGFPSVPACSGASTPSRRCAALLRGLRPLAGLTRPARPGFGGAAFADSARAREDIMLRIYTTIIDALRMLRPAITRIEAHDRDLARQLRRASASIALNTSEGSGCSGGTRRERYRNALGSARETGACLDVAIALGYVEEVDTALLAALDRVRATLAKNVM